MLPHTVECSVCHECFVLPFRVAYYYTGSESVGDHVGFSDLLGILMQPAWCSDCDILSLVEDILPLREFENALGAVRAGHEVEYPVYYSPPRRIRLRGPQHNRESYREGDRLEAERASYEAAAYLRWRMDRRHAPRALCCGGNRFQRLDDPSCKIRHADCEFGFIRQWIHIGPSASMHVGPANQRLYSAEGELIGLLTDSITIPGVDEDIWKVEPLQYSISIED